MDVLSRCKRVVISHEFPLISKNDLRVFPVSEILSQLHHGQLMMVNSRKRNGLILVKSFHAEFAGPGSAIGGEFDRDCQDIIPVGDLSVAEPASQEECQKAYLIRRQWIRLAQQITEHELPDDRVKMILQQFENYFAVDTVMGLPDEAFALLVGVFPRTVHRVRGMPSSP